MNQLIRDYVVACGVALVLTLLIAGATAIPEFETLSYLLTPGLLVATSLFPEGPHSDAVAAWVLLAFVVDILLLGWLVLGVWKGVKRLLKERA